MTSRFDLARCALLALGLAMPPLSAQAADIAVATATIAAPDGQSLGAVTLRQWPAGVMVEVRLKGLTPGAHGIHIHETGDCAEEFAAAGGHFNPAGKGHGFASPAGPHAGDMPNLFAGEDGVANADFLTDRITLAEGPASIFDADGAAIIIHAKPDSYGEDAGAGGRVGCGVVAAQP